jgi:mannose-1-phosphate guanylyltransferase
MARERQIWGLVLAAGDGSRLRALTTSPCGAAVPKQFCSLHGGPTLIEDAFDRAAALVDQQRICTIVAHHHRQWWSGIECVRRLQPGNVIVQPRNCGTAIGVLYSLLHISAISANEADAHIIVLPADHYVRDEETLLRSLGAALQRLAQDASKPVLLGIEPDESDPELGYILPGEPDALGGLNVMRFVEKPDLSAATEIINIGGLWNSFIIAASAHSLIELFLPRYAPIVMEMQVILSRALAAGSLTAAWPTIVDMYERLPTLDFSRDVLEGCEARLCVVHVPPCGWSDLGTPRSVGRTLRRFRPRKHEPADASPTPYLSLAAQHAQLAAQAASL